MSRTRTDGTHARWIPARQAVHCLCRGRAFVAGGRRGGGVVHYGSQRGKIRLAKPWKLMQQRFHPRGERSHRVMAGAAVYAFLGWQCAAVREAGPFGCIRCAHKLAPLERNWFGTFGNLILQSRNQAMHWETPLGNAVANCFRSMAAVDPVFNQYQQRSLAFEVVDKLGWRTFDEFKASMLRTT